MALVPLEIARGIQNKVLEAMAMQKAIVNSNFEWAQELITDGENGYLVNPKNHKLFANRIIELLQNKNKCLALFPFTSATKA